jgi:ABC-type bacteriocin/lantibiotic exporter with double-glycine peptidase domain
MLLKLLHLAANSNRKPTSLPMKVVKILLALITVSLILVLAAVLFIYLAIGAVIVFGYIWWKTRHLRKQMRSASSQHSPQDGFIVEGEVIAETKEQLK